MNQTIQLGSRGEAVAAARAVLEALGYAVPGEPDVFGATMKAAVISFQKDQGLKTDGIIGPNTWAALSKALEMQTGTPIGQNPQVIGFEDDVITGDAPGPQIDNTALIAGLVVAAAVYFFTKKEALGDWEDEEGPEIKRRVKRIPREQTKIKKRKSEPHDVIDMEIDELEDDERGAIVIHTNGKLFKSQRTYREEVKERADDQAEDTGRVVKVVDSKSPGKVLYQAEA